MRTVRGPVTAVIMVGMLLVVTACRFGGSAAPAPSSAAPSQPAASAGLSPQWQAIFDGVGDDGSVSTDTALQAFALTFGALPGVNPPSGDPGEIGDGTFAVRWLVSHWADITADQRAAAIALLPDLAGLGGGAAGGDITTAPAAHLAPLVLASPQRSDFFYQQIAEQERDSITAHTGLTLSLPIVAKVGQAQDANDLAETTPLDGSGAQSGTPASCDILVSAKGDGLVGDAVSQTMAHEVWHCFEAQYGGFGKFTKSNSWIIEGEAEWVGDSLYPDTPQIAAKFWTGYLTKPEKVLFSRSYDAIGFYSQLDQAGVDVWHTLVPILQAPDSASAFDVAGGNDATFLQLWASGVARTPTDGDDWDIDGPAISSDAATPTEMTVGNGASLPVAVKAYTNGLYQLDASADVITVAVPRTRISDGASDTVVDAFAQFCHKQDGCDCPDQADTPETIALPGEDILMAVTGGSDGTSGTITSQSLEDFCKKKNLTGTWEGTWQETAPDSMGGGFTVTWTQLDNQVSGMIEVTGTVCIDEGTVDGQIDGQTITFGAVQGLRRIDYTGTVNADFTQMSGTFSGPTCGEATGPWQAHRVS